ncbi:peptidylprolyl isomerase [Formosa maritima]|uniref:Peptidylprolyl isomerase n=1 Tax=Formosa maritima TaxID=2592046 RepID=A0A5D0G1R7_9FLAO|nr:peptidylprolyl isomerase [Formosa maritima]TYA52510.1 peptidylprolyl isomerase [Formosa maritima]
MLLKIKNLKSIIKINQYLLICFTFLVTQGVSSQIIIEEDEVVEVKKDTIDTSQSRKIDGVAAVVGEYIILDSDIDNTILQLKAQGASMEGVTRCQLFGKLLEDKLYAHQAIQDSVVVSDAEIRSAVDYQLQQFLDQSGKTMEELIEFYNKEDEKSFRDEMFEINKSNKLASEMQRKIIEEVEVTPEEVRQFFSKIPEDERPTFGTELKVSQIVIEPEVSEENKQKAINQLKQFKADILENGASFRQKVVLYTDDKESIKTGGLYTLYRKKPRMVKEFRDVAFSLQEGEISEPFETEFGYHIIYLEKIRGQEFDVRHILIIPEVSQDAIIEAKSEIETIRQRIVDGDISFEEAALEFSDEKETKSEGGFLINPATQDYNFELTRMDPELYGQIQDLKDDEVSLIITDRGRTGNVKFKIMMVSDRIDEHVADFSRDYLKIKELALNEKRFKVIEEWQEEKIMETYIKINGEHRDCEFTSNWLKK